MSTITVEVQDDRKRDFLLALLAELNYGRVVVEDAGGANTAPQMAGEPQSPSWKGQELHLKPARPFTDVVREQGNKAPRFEEFAGSWEEDTAGVSLEELLEASK